MSIDARIADNQPDSFAFTRENEAEIKRIVAKYPKGRQASAVMPLLDLVQRQHDNWIPMKAIELIAKKLDMAEIRVLEVATFYTMYNKSRVGDRHIQVCKSISCAVMKAYSLVEYLESRLGIRAGETTPDGKFTLTQAECLAVCGYGPAFQCNDDYHEGLSLEDVDALIEQLRQEAGKGGA